MREGIVDVLFFNTNDGHYCKSISVRKCADEYLIIASVYNPNCHMDPGGGFSCSIKNESLEMNDFNLFCKEAAAIKLFIEVECNTDTDKLLLEIWNYIRTDKPAVCDPNEENAEDLGDAEFRIPAETEHEIDHEKIRRKKTWSLVKLIKSIVHSDP